MQIRFARARLACGTMNGAWGSRGSKEVGWTVSSRAHLRVIYEQQCAKKYVRSRYDVFGTGKLLWGVADSIDARHEDHSDRSNGGNALCVVACAARHSEC